MALWQAGQSGNPAGKPAGTLNRSTAAVRRLAHKHSAKAVETLARILVNEEMPPQARVMAARELLDRAVGKPAQAITGPDGGALQLMSRVIHEHLLAAPKPEVLDVVEVKSLPSPEPDKAS